MIQRIRMPGPDGDVVRDVDHGPRKARPIQRIRTDKVGAIPLSELVPLKRSPAGGLPTNDVWPWDWPRP